MPKPNRGKTQTVTQRRVDIYLPSITMRNEWKQRAQHANQSLSKFVINRVLDSIQQEEREGEYHTRLELIRQLSEAQEELKALRQDNRHLKKLVDVLDTELKRYRAKPFLDDEFTGTRELDRELINLLRRGGIYTGDDVLTQLNIDPVNVDLVKAINKQLEILERYGLVEYAGRGWKWVR